MEEYFLVKLEVQDGLLVIDFNPIVIKFHLLNRHFFYFVISFLLVEWGRVAIREFVIVEVKVHSAETDGHFLNFVLDLHEDDVEGFLGDIVMGHS